MPPFPACIKIVPDCSRNYSGDPSWLQTVMAKACEYCQSVCDEDALKCINCGAPVGASAQDFRSCPYCRRKLISLASPACNYCGRRLPEKYIKAREADLRRIRKRDTLDDNNAVKDKVDEMIRRSSRQSGSMDGTLIDFVDLIDLTDLFS